MTILGFQLVRLDRCGLGSQIANSIGYRNFRRRDNTTVHQLIWCDRNRRTTSINIAVPQTCNPISFWRRFNANWNSEQLANRFGRDVELNGSFIGKSWRGHFC